MNILHKRAYVQGRAVAYCQAGYEGKQPTTTSDAAKVNCPRCKDIAAGRG